METRGAVINWMIDLRWIEVTFDDRIEGIEGEIQIKKGVSSGGLSGRMEAWFRLLFQRITSGDALHERCGRSRSLPVRRGWNMK